MIQKSGYWFSLAANAKRLRGDHDQARSQSEMTIRGNVIPIQAGARHQLLRTDLRYSSGLLESNSLPRMISLPKPPAGGEAPLSRMIFDASVASITCSASFL